MATKEFHWKTDNGVVHLKVNDEDCEIILSIKGTPKDIVEEISSKMRELNDIGTYPNEKTSQNDASAQFVSRCHYNWNCRKSDFRKIVREEIIDGLLGGESTKEPQR